MPLVLDASVTVNWRFRKAVRTRIMYLAYSP